MSVNTVPEIRKSFFVSWVVAAMLAIAVAVALAALLLPRTATAATSPNGSAEPTLADLSPKDRSDIARIQTYLNNIHTLQAGFLQVSSQGGYSQGVISLSRPGKMRIAYAPPTHILIVADGQFLIYNDTELGQVSYVPIGSTAADILLNKNIKLTGGDLEIIDFVNADHVLRVSVVRKKDPLGGVLTLIFDDNPLALRKWTIKDAQGILTTVSLQNPRFGIPLNPKLFHFKAPLMSRPKD